MAIGIRHPGVVTAAAVALAGAAVFAGETLVQAVLLRPLPAPAAASPPWQAPSFNAAHGAPPGAVTLAAASNPFRPDRRAATNRFRMPGESVDTTMRKAATNVADEVRLIGTGLVPGGRDFVVCQASGVGPRLIRVGGKCGELLLIRVAPMKARFKTADGSPVTLNVPKAGT